MLGAETGLRQHFGRDELPMNAAPTAELGRIAGRWWRWWPAVDSREVTFANFPLRGSHDVAILCLAGQVKPSEIYSNSRFVFNMLQDIAGSYR